MILDEEAKATQWRKESFHQVVLEQLDIHMQEKIKKSVWTQTLHTTQKLTPN